MGMNNLGGRAILAVALLALAGCDEAVKINQATSYVAQGDPQGALYPVEIRRDGEDVRIVLKQSAPIPEVMSVDPQGRSQAYNFTSSGSVLIVPGKFSHLQLRHAGVGAVDILPKSAGK